MNNLKEKILVLAESRLELLDYSSDEIVDIDLESYSVGELILMIIGANEVIFNEDDVRIGKQKSSLLVEYDIKDKEVEYIKSLQVYDIPVNDKHIQYQQLSLINFS